MPQPAQPPPPAWVGPYRIVQTLAPCAYKALDDRIQSVVHLVVLPPGTPPLDSAALRRTAAAHLGADEDDVQVLASGEAEGATYVAVEPIDPNAPKRRPDDREGTGLGRRLLRGVAVAWGAVARRPGLLAATGLAMLVVGLAAFCGGGPSRLAPSSTYRRAVSRIDAFLDAEAKSLAVEAARLDVPRLAAAIEAIERAEPGDASLRLLAGLETEIDSARIGADVVCVVNRTGDLVSTRGQAGATEALYDAWRVAGQAARVLAITDVPWIAAVVPLRAPGEDTQLCGWALAGRALDPGKVSALAAEHEVVILWEVHGAAWQSGSELRDDARMAVDAIGSRTIPGGREVVRFAGVLHATVRLAGATSALAGVALLVAALRRRAKASA